MPYTVQIDKSALKDLESMPSNLRRRIEDKIDGLAENPRPAGVKKLKGRIDHYRIRAGDYRVVYTIKDKILLVIVIEVGHRRDVYR